MAIRYAIEKHAVAGASKLLATNYGGHIYNVTLSSDTDNGNIIKRGDWISFDNYAEDTATTFNGVIRQQAANGNWYVEVLEDMGFDALLVYNVPVIEEDFNNKFKAESNYFVAKGEVARAHQLYKGDIFEVSAEGFDGDPEVGATITSISDKKLVVASDDELVGA